jgi:hypothetical protein
MWQLENTNRLLEMTPAKHVPTKEITTLVRKRAGTLL